MYIFLYLNFYTCLDHILFGIYYFCSFGRSTGVIQVSGDIHSPNTWFLRLEKRSHLLPGMGWKWQATTSNYITTHTLSYISVYQQAQSLKWISLHPYALDDRMWAGITPLNVLLCATIRCITVRNNTLYYYAQQYAVLKLTKNTISLFQVTYVPKDLEVPGEVFYQCSDVYVFKDFKQFEASKDRINFL